MKSLELFNELINNQSKKFNQWLEQNNFFRVYTHFDADGISSGTIMINFLKSKLKGFQLTIIEQLNDENIKKIKEKGNPLILLDFGSGQLNKLKHLINNRQVLIIDHHQPQGEITSNNLIHINPCLINLEAGSKVSASGVTYLFLKKIGVNESNASLALIGARGDFTPINSVFNNQILKDSNLTERKDLNIYGLNSRPLHKALEYTEENFIPNISGDETACVNLLNELNIPLKEGSDWRTINDLTSKEKQELISAIIIKRAGLSNPEDIFTTVYELSIGRKRSLSEWSAVLNACGRMNMASMGVSALLNPSYENKIDVVLKEYKNLIAEGLRWIDSNENNNNFIKKTSKAFYFIAKKNINYKIVGTICSIKSNGFNKEFIVGFADNENNTKVSVRRVINNGLKASELVIKACKGIGEGGGHPQAAGATIIKGKESEFINRFEEQLNT